MPLARQYGLTYDEFWHGDMRLLEVAQKAYIRDKSYTAWVNGQYSAKAFSLSLNNAFAKKGTPPEQYSQWKDPFEKFNKPKITKDNLEEEFRKQQLMQQNWLFNR